ncbi:hypothetical protein N9D35_02725 [Gammaproteobacteria bacterium]|nr:hypothetical protein [Gammaproteobacteria bacterium]
MKPNTLSAYKITPSHILQLIAVMAFPASLLIFDGGVKLNISLDVLVSIPAFYITVAASLILAIIFKLSGNIAIGKTLLATGIPLGLMSSYIGVILIVNNMSDLSSFGPAITVMLLTALYGGLISALGFAVSYSSVKDAVRPVKKRYIIAAAIAIIMLVINAIGVDQLPYFYDSSIILLYLVFIFSFLIFNKSKKHFTIVISDAALFTSIIIIIVSLISWFGQTSLDAEDSAVVTGPIVFASLGVMYGALIYLFVYIFSMGCEAESKINVEKMNWHLIEVNTLLLFLAFAPVSVSEYIEKTIEADQRQVESQENAALIENLVNRIEQLERTQ